MEDKEYMNYVQVNFESKNEYYNWYITFNEDYKISWLNIDTYISDKINLKNTKEFTEKKVKVGEYSLTGILTLLKNTKKTPVVIIVLGSGPTSANGTFLLNRPYADIAYNFAKQGIATLCYNDRYYERGDLYKISDEDKQEKLNILAKENEEINNITEDSDEKIWNLSKTYWRSLNNLNPKESFDKLTIPILILQGAKDTQVLANIDYKG